ARFVKTSTGFGSGGATIQDVQLLRDTVGPKFGVKASGGIRDTASALAMIEAGATRIGTSNGVKILQGLPALAFTGRKGRPILWSLSPLDPYASGHSARFDGFDYDRRPNHSHN